MSNLPHVAVGEPATEEHIRVYEAYLREHDMPVAGSPRIPTAAVMNKAVEWWNQLQPEDAQEATSDG